MRRTNQGGSVLGFIIGSVLLALLLVGGVYLIQLQRIPASQATPQKPQETPAESSPPEQTQSKPQEESTQSSKPDTSTPTQLPSNGSETTHHQMPQTGPGEAVLPAVALAIVSGLFVSYVRSRRLLASL